MYISADVASRIKAYADTKNVTYGKMFAELEMGPNTLQNFKTSMPKANTLARIADYLDCSVDYLLGRTDNPESHKPRDPETVE